MDETFTRPVRPIHPYRSAIVIMAGMTGLFALPTALIGFLDAGSGAMSEWFWLGGIACGFFGLLLLIVWVLGRAKAGRMVAFLGSDRPLVRWTYTEDEWAQIQALRRQEAAGDGRLQLGCLTGLFALVGLLVGGMVGAEEGWGEAIGGGAAGLALGAGTGALIGGIVAGGNALAGRWADRDPPDQVALGRDEIMANGDYFRGKGRLRAVRGARLEPGRPATLVVDIWSPKVRGEAEETWVVVVPDRAVEAVRAALPRLAGGGR